MCNSALMKRIMHARSKSWEEPYQERRTSRTRKGRVKWEVIPWIVFTPGLCRCAWARTKSFPPATNCLHLCSSYKAVYRLFICVVDGVKKIVIEWILEEFQYQICLYEYVGFEYLMDIWGMPKYRIKKFIISISKFGDLIIMVWYFTFFVKYSGIKIYKKHTRKTYNEWHTR